MIVRNFEYLLALYQEGHFGNAAKSCNVSQPTLSAGIKQLEEDMGVQIVRHGRRYDGLTVEGMRVLAWAQQMYDDCKGLERELSALREGTEGEYRLGMLPGTAVMASILSVALAKKIPLLQQSISIANSSALFHAIRERELDMALVHLEDVTGENFDTHLLYRESLILFQVDKTKELRSVTWEHLLDTPLCLLNSSVPEVANARLRQCTAKIIRTDSIDVLAAQVATGKYAAVLPQSFAGKLIEIPHLQAITIASPLAHFSVGFIAAKSGLKSGASHTLLDMIHKTELAVSLRSTLSVYRRLRRKSATSK